MPAPLIPILARVALGLARSGAVRGALGAAGRSGAARKVPAIIQRLGAGGRRMAGRQIVPRNLLASVGRRQGVRQAVRFLRRPRRGRPFSGRLLAAAGRLGINIAIPSHQPQRQSPQPGQPGGPQGPPLPPQPGQQGGPQGPPPPPPPPPAPTPPGPPSNPTLPAVQRVGGALVKLTGIIGATAAAIAGYMLATEKLTRLLAEQRRELAPYSGQIASAFSRLEVQDLQSRIRTAQGTAGSSAMLIDAVTRQHRAMEQMNRDFMTLNNTVGTLQAVATEIGGHIYSGVRNTSGFGLVLDAIEKNTRNIDGGNTVPEKMLKEMLGPNFGGPRDRAPLPPLK